MNSEQFDRFKYHIYKYKVNPEISRLRFDQNCIAVSTIEDAYFCEKKLDFIYSDIIDNLPESKLIEYTKDQVEVVGRQSIGTDGHSSIEDITSSEYGIGGIAECRLVALYKGIKIIGVADAVRIKDDYYDLYDYKFRGIVPSYGSPYPEHPTQCRVYCYCLNQMITGTEFDMPIKYHINYFPSSCKQCETFEECFLYGAVCDKGSLWKSFEYDYDDRQIQKTKRELDFVIEYWLESRNAIPTKSQYKCSKCEFRSVCNERRC